ncbi:MAG: UPF0149 family protein, partial [Gammaproteobacteria bacterium]
FMGNETMAMWLWLAHMVDKLPEQGDVLAHEHLEVLKLLFSQTREHFSIEEMSLELLLPDDSEDLSRRLYSLASWCQGFLYGITVNGLRDSAPEDEQSQECLSDLIEISKLDAEAVQSEEAEQQLVDLVEHVRMSVLILSETLTPAMPEPPEPPEPPEQQE